jgi:hypothetical protein
MLMLFVRAQKLAIEKWPYVKGEIMELFIFSIRPLHIQLIPSLI